MELARKVSKFEYRAPPPKPSNLRPYGSVSENKPRVVMRVPVFPKPKLTMDDIISETCVHFQMRRECVSSAARYKQFVKARQVVSYLSRELLNFSFPKIGREMGGRDHSTIVHAYYRMKKMIAKDHPLVADMEAIRAKLLTKFPLDSIGKPCILAAPISGEKIESHHR